MKRTERATGDAGRDDGGSETWKKKKIKHVKKRKEKTRQHTIIECFVDEMLSFCECISVGEGKSKGREIACLLAGRVPLIFSVFGSLSII